MRKKIKFGIVLLIMMKSMGMKLMSFLVLFWRLPLKRIMNVLEFIIMIFNFELLLTKWMVLIDSAFCFKFGWCLEFKWGKDWVMKFFFLVDASTAAKWEFCSACRVLFEWCTREFEDDDCWIYKKKYSASIAALTTFSKFLIYWKN